MREPPLLYLSSGDVLACLPEISQQVELVRQALQALGSGDGEMPPKIGVHPRPQALVEAMPAWLKSRDIVGMKWVSAYPDNRSHGRDHIQGIIVINEAETGRPQCVLDARQITAARTAAVSAFAVQLLGSGNGASCTALFGAGVQGRAHAHALGALGLIGELRVFDRNDDRAAALAAWAQSDLGLASARAFPSAIQALAGAQLVVSCASLGPKRQLLDYRSVAAVELIIAIDDDVYVSSDVVEQCGLFIVDDPQQFKAFRSSGGFAGFRDPDASLADVVSGRLPKDQRPVVMIAIGTGVVDLVFASAVFVKARSIGLGAALSV